MQRYFKNKTSNHIVSLSEGRNGVKSGSLLDRTINNPKYQECSDRGVILDKPKKTRKANKKIKKGKK